MHKIVGLVMVGATLIACDQATSGKSYGNLEGYVKLAESNCTAQGLTLNSADFVECVNKQFDPTGGLPPTYFGR